LYDLAQTYSCISDEVGKANIKARFDEIVYFEFKRKLNLTGQAKYLKRLQEAEKIWKETAFQE
jgi:PAB1-binding protein PBP1